jgi:hypothetical protein
MLRLLITSFRATSSSGHASREPSPVSAGPQARHERSRGVFAPKAPFVAETEDELCFWLAHRFGPDLVKVLTIRSMLFIWLPRPPRPREYPSTFGTLRLFLRHQQVATEPLESELENMEKVTYVVLGFAGRRGPGFAALRISKPDGVRNGFRRTPPREILLQRCI